jgi:hypothetical protein
VLNLINRLWKRWLLPITNNATAAVVIGAALLATYGQLSGKTAQLFSWLGDHVTISRWQLPAEFIGGLLVATVIIWMGKRQQRAQPKSTFQPLVVSDPNYPIEWRIQWEPREWLNDTRIAAHSPSERQRILSGPYHVVCKSELEMGDDGYNDDSGPCLLPKCPVCEVNLFAIGEDYENPALSDVRLEAIEEIQRQARYGVVIKNGMSLEKPLYWKRIKPASKRPKRS